MEWHAEQLAARKEREMNHAAHSDALSPQANRADSANLIAGDGTKNGLSRSEQKTVSTTQNNGNYALDICQVHNCQNNRLTGKAPYRFESRSLQERVHCELDRMCLVESGSCRSLRALDGVERAEGAHSSHCAGQQEHQIAPPDSMTSSARARIDWGMLRPSALAVLRLMTRGADRFASTATRTSPRLRGKMQETLCFHGITAVALGIEQS